MGVFEEIGFAPDKLHETFAASDYGKELSGQPRWDRYKPTEMPAAEWIATLGADFDNLQHHAYSYLLADGFIKYNHEYATDTDGVLNPEEEGILLLTALTNDWAEAVVGDVNYELKTTDDVVSEREKFGPIFSELVGPVGIKYQYVIEDVLFGKRDSLVGKAWDAVERMSYLHDTLNAFRALNETEDEVLASHLRWLVAAALPNQTSKLLEYSKIFPAVRYYLQENSDLITEAYDTLDPQIFTAHGQKERQKAEQFLFERDYWTSRKVESASSIETQIIETLEQTGIDATRVGQIKRLIQDFGEQKANPHKPFVSREAYDRGILGSGTNFEARVLPSVEAAAQMADALRVLNLRIVLTSGSFDMWHIGHARYIELAKKHGDFLIVGIDSDAKIRQRKGPNRPMVPENERLEIVAHERSVDALILKNTEEEKWALIKAIRPDTLIVTEETYSEDEKRALTEYCGRVVSLPPQATTSTSARIRGLHMELGSKIAAKLPEHLNEIIRKIIEE